MLIADASRAPLVALIPLLHALDALSFPLLLALAAAIAAFATPSFAAKASILPDLIGEDERVVSEANALLQAAQRITLFAGPALAGVLIAVIGPMNVLLIDAASFAIGVVLVATLVHGGGRVEQDEESRGLAAGFRFLARDPLLRPWSVALIIGDVAWIVLFAAMPVLVLTRFGEDPALLGWIWGAWGLGAVLGNVISFRTVARSDRLLISSIGELAMIAPLWLLLTDGPPLTLIAVMAASGLANGIVNPPIFTIFTLRDAARAPRKGLVGDHHRDDRPRPYRAGDGGRRARSRGLRSRCPRARRGAVRRRDRVRGGRATRARAAGVPA